MILRGILRVGLAAISISGCGGIIGGQSDGGASDGSGADSTSFDAGWTACSSPSGYQLCGGPNDCYPDCPSCAMFGPVGFCVDSQGTLPFPVGGGCDSVQDGWLCALLPLGTSQKPDGGPGNDYLSGMAVAWEAGELLYRTGYPLVYADSSSFDGAPLPAPSDCPTVPGLTLCGGACGDTCPHDQTHGCMGRSPAHPYSLCLDTAPLLFGGSPAPHCSRANPPGDGIHGCLIFRVSPSDQPVADSNGVWIDLPTCQAAAAGYPGGTDCVTQ